MTIDYTTASPVEAPFRRPLALIRLGEAPRPIRERHGGFEAWFRAGLGNAMPAMEVLAPARGDALPVPESVAGVVLTGSATMVTDLEPWSELTAAWLRQVVPLGTPVLGVCYGHQLLAHALGGVVGYNPRGMEIGTVPIQRLPAADEDVLLGPLAATFTAQAVHSQSVLTLPPDAVALAANDWDAHHAFRLGACAWGVQFHPEIPADAMDDYVGLLAPDNRAARESVHDTPQTARILSRFAALVAAREAARVTA